MNTGNEVLQRKRDSEIQNESGFSYSRLELIQKFKKTRSCTEVITNSLEIEDFVVQVSENASPAKWHLAHTTWFFETFLLEKELDDYDPVHPQYSYLFNSYYLQTGVPHCRARRGNISRPTVKQVFEYRESINEHVINLIYNATDEQYEKWGVILEIGIHHEQQHQELLMTDLKFMFSQNPMNPVYKKAPLHWQNTTENSCAISMYCGAARVQHLNLTSERPIETFFIPLRGGSLREFD